MPDGYRIGPSDLVAEALELSEAAALEAFSAEAMEVVSSKFAVSGWFLLNNAQKKRLVESLQNL